MIRRLSLIALPALAGSCFAAYQILRPYPPTNPETGAVGAAAVASNAWTGAHTLAMVGIVALMFWVPLIAVRWGRRYAWLGPLAVGAGAALLPYYGAETFGLGSIARRAVADEDWSLLSTFADVRYALVPTITFALGLLALAVLGVALAVGWWRQERPRALMLPMAFGLVVYLPQFFTPPAGRMSHGLLLAAGGIATAVALVLARSATPILPAERPSDDGRTRPTVAA